jgi:hypothetical protein
MEIISKKGGIKRELSQKKEGLKRHKPDKPSASP